MISTLAIVLDPLSLLQLIVLTGLTGGLMGWLFGISPGMRWLAVVYGIAGIELGTWLWSMWGLDLGPSFGQVALVPLFAGTLTVAAFVKLVAVAIAGSSQRWTA